MIAPINVTPPQIQPTNGQLANTKINTNIQQSNLSVTAANSPDLLAPASLKKSSATKIAKKTVQNIQLSTNHQFTLPTVVAQAADVKAMPAPSSLAPIESSSNIQPVGDVPLGDNLAQNDPAPLPPPSQITPQEPVFTSPQPSGRPPVEPANYPQSTGIYYNQNYVGPAISFGKNTLVGGVSRFAIGKNTSIRPSLFLGNSTRISVPVTYDFVFNENEPFERNPLVVLHAGGGLDYRSDNGSNGSQLNPLVVFGADVYLGDGASVLVQVGNTFSDFVGTIGVGLQF